MTTTPSDVLSSKPTLDLHLRDATVDDLPSLLSIIHAAYREYEGKLDPPSGAHRETVESLAGKLARGGGVIAIHNSQPVGSVLYEPRVDSLYVGRLAVLPAYRRLRVGQHLAYYVEEIARRLQLPAITLGVRISLSGNLAFYRSLGYDIVGTGAHPGYREPTFYTMQKRLDG